MLEHTGQAADVYGYRREDWFGLFQAHGYRTFDLFGRLFTPEHWYATGVPWCLTAAKQAEDLRFVEEDLPLEIAGIYARLMTPAAR